MSRPVKIISIILLIAVLFAGLVLQKWYSFTTSSQITKERGVFADDSLEVWIDLNAHMPSSMRLWACKTLLAREAAIAGGNALHPPYSCDPDFEAQRNMSQSDSLIAAYTSGAAQIAKSKGATDAQLDQVKTCVATDFKASLTPDQTAAMDGTVDSDTVVALSNLSNTVTTACLTKAGL
jgi:hypothetical protein